VSQAIAAHEGVADNPQQVLAAGAPADAPSSGGLLGRIFGAHHGTVSSGVQQASGLDADQVKKLLLMLSPVLLGMLARRQFGNQQNPGGLGSVLQQEAQSAARQSPQMGGLLGSLFNTFGGGSTRA
jgi:hypothetical protein